MVWAFIVIWVVGGVLFGFMVWAGAVGAAGVLSRIGRWSASGRRNRKEDVGRPLSRPSSCRFHVVRAERPSSWHVHALHGSHAGPNRGL